LTSTLKLILERVGRRNIVRVAWIDKHLAETTQGRVELLDSQFMVSSGLVKHAVM
jgi:hypothetical protein